MANRSSRTDNLDYNMEQSYHEEENPLFPKTPYKHVFKPKEIQPFMETFEFANSAKNLVKKFRSQRCNFVRFRINFTNSKIEGDFDAFVNSADDLPSKVPLLSSTVNLYRFRCDKKTIQPQFSNNNYFNE